MAAKKTCLTDKSATRKSKKTAPCVRVFVEGNGRQYEITDVAERAMADCMSAPQTGKVETLDVYCKIEDGCAYYTVNGIGSPETKVIITEG